MTRCIKSFVLTIAASLAIATAAHAQTSSSSSFSNSWSSSSGSSWGTRADGTTFRTGFSNADSRQQATATTSNGSLFGTRTNTTSIDQSQSSRQGFSQSSGPQGFQQSGFNNQSGNLSVVNQRTNNGIFGNSSDTRSLNAQFDNRNSFSQGIGSGGIFDNRTSRNSGSVTVGRNVSANSVFGPSVQAGSTRTAGFVNEQGVSRGINSGGLFNNQFNNQSINTSGNDFFRVFP